MKVLKFNGKKYTLNQCCDIFTWLSESHEGEYTNYYGYVVFNTNFGFFAADCNNLNNFWKI